MIDNMHTFPKKSKYSWLAAGRQDIIELEHERQFNKEVKLTSLHLILINAVFFYKSFYRLVDTRIRCAKKNNGGYVTMVRYGVTIITLSKNKGYAKSLKSFIIR